MLTVPFALSIHKFIDSIGADVGFASIIAVALLVLLYFAHARETATLRDRLEEAHARIAGLEARLSQMLTAQAGAQRQRGAAPAAAGGPLQPGVAAPAGAGARPPGAAIPSVRRIPTATAAAAASAAAVTAAVATNGGPPVAPAGVGAPALASATKLIPTVSLSPVVTPAPDAAIPDATMFIPGGAQDGLPVGGAPTNGAPSVTPPPTAPPLVATPALPPVTVPHAARPSEQPLANPSFPSRARRPGTSPPRVQLKGDDSGEGRRRSPIGSLVDEDFGGEGGRRLSGRLVPLLISAVAVVVIVVALILITGSGSGTPTTGKVNHPAPPAQTGAGVTKPPKPKPFDAAKVQVAVLNGTAVAGLAGDMAKVLKRYGYRQGNVTNASVQTQATTVVYYVTGSNPAANLKAAQHVAESLSLPATSVQPATQAALQSCATGPTGNALGSCAANVIVSVGSDRASLASSSAG